MREQKLDAEHREREEARLKARQEREERDAAERREREERELADLFASTRTIDMGLLIYELVLVVIKLPE